MQYYAKNAQTKEGWKNAAATSGAPIVNTGKMIGEIGGAIADGNLEATARLLGGLPLSYLSGDIVDKKLEVTVGKNGEEQIYTANGILTDAEQAKINMQQTGKKIDETAQLNRAGNDSHGPIADFLQSSGYMLGAADISAVREADQIKELKNNGNLKIDAHSQGTAMTARAFDLLKSEGESLKNIDYAGYGPQETVEKKFYGLNNANNYADPSDKVAVPCDILNNVIHAATIPAQVLRGKPFYETAEPMANNNVGPFHHAYAEKSKKNKGEYNGYVNGV
jgi:hypothetical protein